MRLMIRAILLAVLLNSLLCLTVLAQTETQTEMPTPQSVELEQNVAVLKESKAEPVSKHTGSTAIDLNDPALIEALDARTKADRAIAEAIKAQKDALDKQEGVESEEANTAPALLDPKNLKALAQKWGDKILGWLTSIPFLAQIGAIILAYVTAPF